MSHQPKRMRFGAFFAPFHNERFNPTIALERDMDLIRHMDRLDFDEAWIGEHHSGAYETIPSPEVFIAAAAERARRIRFGTGVSSLSFHQPLVLADRIAQLDHQTRGRMMFGVGPGQLVTDAHMMGVDPLRLRERMAESLDALVKLLDGETVSVETDWFVLREARMHILPYQANLEIAVASSISPAGARLAGRHGAGMLSMAASSPKGFAALAESWKICEEQAKKHGKTVSRDAWRVVAPVHLAETREQAVRDLEHGLLDLFQYFRKFGGEVFPEAKDHDEAVEIWTSSGIGALGVAVVGTPDDLIRRIEELQQRSGGFGCFLNLAHNGADYEATKKSYELLAQYVMPRFQRSNANRAAALDWAGANAGQFMKAHKAGIDKATAEHEAEQGEKKKKGK